jgi:hypothetical protein
VQTMTMNTTRQLVADHQAALGGAARRGRLRRMLSRANGSHTVSLDLAALEHAEEPTPAVILPARVAAAPDAGRVDKVA